MNQYYMFPVAAADSESLKSKLGYLLKKLEVGSISSRNIADVSYTLQKQQDNSEFRLYFTAPDRDILREKLNDVLEMEPGSLSQMISSPDPEGSEVIFIFQGLGDQYLKMAKDLYDGLPYFRDKFDYSSNLIEPQLGFNLAEFLYHSGDEEKLKTPEIAHTTLFIIEHTIATLLREWGVTPSAFIGHSLGEYIAACAAGVFSLDDALKLVFSRARMIAKLSRGSMLAVMLSEREIEKYLDDSLSVAAINAPSFLTVSGPEENIKKLGQRLAEDTIASIPLATTHAFHSKSLVTLKDEFTGLFSNIKMSPPQVPLISNLTGSWLTEQEALTPRYWFDQMCNPVQFCRGVQELSKINDPLFIEIGPSMNMASFIGQTLFNSGNPPQKLVILPSMKSKDQEKNDFEILLESLGSLWVNGPVIDWDRMYDGGNRPKFLSWLKPA